MPAEAARKDGPRPHHAAVGRQMATLKEGVFVGLIRSLLMPILGSDLRNAIAPIL
jgi:hypothetical protein